MSPAPLERPGDWPKLAFYWALLAPHRTVFPKPEGVLVLRDGAENSTTVRVALSPEDFKEVHRLIAAVRTARSEGVEPRVCNCHICAQCRPQVLASVGRRRDLTMVFGISWDYAAALGALGARRYAEAGISQT